MLRLASYSLFLSAVLYFWTQQTNFFIIINLYNYIVKNDFESILYYFTTTQYMYSTVQM